MRRRELLKAAGLAALMGRDLAFGQTGQEGQGARAPVNDRIGIGLIGVGNFGTANLRQFLRHPDVEVAAICDVYHAACWNHSPSPAPRTPVTGGPPPGMDWDMWLGPAPKLPYDEVWNVGRRGYWDFWGGMLTEWGSHLADIVLWAMNAPACRLGNIAYRVGRALRWDAGHEQVIGDPEANRLAVGTYRDPWKPRGLWAERGPGHEDRARGAAAGHLRPPVKVVGRSRAARPARQWRRARRPDRPQDPAVHQATALREPLRKLHGRRSQPRRTPRHRVRRLLVRGTRLRAPDLPPAPRVEGVPAREQRSRVRRRPGRLAGRDRRRLGRGRHLLVQEPGPRRGGARQALGDAPAVGGAPAGQDPRPHGDVRPPRLRRRRGPRAALGLLPEAGAPRSVAIHEGTGRDAGARALRPRSAGRGHGFAFGDVNGDGREDVLTEIGWYERPTGDPFAGPWRLHAETALPHPSCPFVVKDLNRDGRLDIIFGRGHDVGLYWWEQLPPRPDGATAWRQHVIDESWSQAHAPALVDLDRDGEERGQVHLGPRGR